MKAFLGSVLMLSRLMQTVAGVFLTFMMLLTSMDVVLRIFGYPVPGAVEIIAICGGFVIGLTVPITSWRQGHISVDLLTSALPDSLKKAVDIATRCVGVGLFLLISWNSMKIGTGFWKAGEVSGTLQLPLYPVAYGLALSFFMLSIVLFCHILRILGGHHE